MLAAVCCIASYAALHAVGFGNYRSEFLGASLFVGALGVLAILLARLTRGPSWLHWLGLFLLNWLFAAYVLSYFAL